MQGSNSYQLPIRTSHFYLDTKPADHSIKTVSYRRSQKYEAFVTRKSYGMRIRCFLSEFISILWRFDVTTVQRLKVRQLWWRKTPEKVDLVAPPLQIIMTLDHNGLIPRDHRHVSRSHKCCGVSLWLAIRDGEVLLEVPKFVCSGTFQQYIRNYSINYVTFEEQKISKASIWVCFRAKWRLFCLLSFQYFTTRGNITIT